jgi:hypothetical protein
MSIAFPLGRFGPRVSFSRKLLSPSTACAAVGLAILGIGVGAWMGGKGPFKGGRATLQAAPFKVLDKDEPYKGWDPSIQEDVDGRKLPPDRQFPKWDVVRRYRPWVKEDHRSELVVGNMHLHNITNQKAIDIVLTSPDKPTPIEGEPNTYSKVTVRNCNVENIWRDETGGKLGLHIDFLRICGGGDEQPIWTDVLVEDYYIHDGNALPLLIQDGKFNTITLRRVKIERSALGSVQISAMNCGHINKVIVEDCPGLRVALMGRPGSIDSAVVRNSPGAAVMDTRNHAGASGVVITEENGPTASSNDPAPVKIKTGTAPEKTTQRKPVVEPGPAPKPAVVATPKAKIKAEPSKDGSSVHITLENADTSQIAFVVFEAFDPFDYRQGSPVVVTEKPFAADIKIQRAGMITCKATINTLASGELDPITENVEVKK